MEDTTVLEIDDALSKLKPELHTPFIDNLLGQYCCEHNRQVVERLLALGAKYDGDFKWFNFDVAHVDKHLSVDDNYFESACENGKESLVEQIMTKTPITESRLQSNLLVACRKGHIAIVKRLLNALPEPVINWEDVMYNSCYGGNRPLIDFIIGKNDTMPVLRKGLIGACCGRQSDIAELMIEIIGPNGGNALWREAMSWLFQRDTRDIARILEKKLNAEEFEDACIQGLYHTCENDCLNIAIHILRRMSNPESKIELWNKCFIMATINGALEIMQEMFCMGANNLDEARVIANEPGVLLIDMMKSMDSTPFNTFEIVEYFMRKEYEESGEHSAKFSVLYGYYNDRFSLEECLMAYHADDPLDYACKHGTLRLVDMLIP